MVDPTETPPRPDVEGLRAAANKLSGFYVTGLSKEQFDALCDYIFALERRSPAHGGRMKRLSDSELDLSDPDEAAYAADDHDPTGDSDHEG